jgi:hypothetical protein
MKTEVPEECSAPETFVEHNSFWLVLWAYIECLQQFSRTGHCTDKEQLEATSCPARLGICSHACHRTLPTLCWRQLVEALYRRMLSEADSFALHCTQISDLKLRKLFETAYFSLYRPLRYEQHPASTRSQTEPLLFQCDIHQAIFCVILYGCACLLKLAIL